MFEYWIVGGRVGQSTEMGEITLILRDYLPMPIRQSYRVTDYFNEIDQGDLSISSTTFDWENALSFFPVWICTRNVQKCARKISCTTTCTRERRQATEKIFAPEAIRSNATQHEATCCVALLVSKHAHWTYSGAIRYVALRCVALLLWKPSLTELEARFVWSA